MKKFNFKLESVLKHRKNREDQQKKELAHIDALRRESEKVLEQLKAEEETWREELNAKQQEVVDVRDIQLYYSHIFNIEKHINKKVVQTNELIGKMNTAREKLIDLRKDKMSLEKLKEKQYEEFRHQVDLVEQKFIDELGVTRFNRKKEDGQ